MHGAHGKKNMVKLAVNGKEGGAGAFEKKASKSAVSNREGKKRKGRTFAAS